MTQLIKFRETRNIKNMRTACSGFNLTFKVRSGSRIFLEISIIGSPRID